VAGAAPGEGARPFVLVILDGWGFSADPFGNAIHEANTPEIERLMRRCPTTLVAASGEAVGLPRGQQGNSEVGHLTIGAGRVVYQPLSRINRAVADGSFSANPVLCAAVDRARDRGKSLHLLGLVSPGGVHSHMDHAVALAKLAKQRGLDDVYVHAFTDGRDEPPMSGAGYMQTFVDDLATIGAGRVASVSGRYYAMDRDRRWERTRRAYDVVVSGAGAQAADAVAYIESEYEADRGDEFVLPASIVRSGSAPCHINDGDSIVFFNFRPDRARQLTHAIVDREFSAFERGRVVRDLAFVTMTEYERTLPVHIAFPTEDVAHTLAAVVAAHGLRQFHVAETEKYAHVTYFINGGRERAFPGEERLLVPSQRVATYDAVPEMSAPAITDAVIAHLQRGDDALIVVNFANADMVGHTGDLDATVRAVEVVDACIGRIVRAVGGRGGAVLITADHGNAERMTDKRDGSPLTAHTTSAVPVILCGTPATALRDGGGLRDIAPTVLDAMAIPAPDAMTGRSLVLSRAQD
jgi:2,3-bisphosphoglycerate-independent phosphoglycerate mutase